MDRWINILAKDTYGQISLCLLTYLTDNNEFLYHDANSSSVNLYNAATKTETVFINGSVFVSILTNRQ